MVPLFPGERVGLKALSRLSSQEGWGGGGRNVRFSSSISCVLSLVKKLRRRHGRCFSILATTGGERGGGRGHRLLLSAERGRDLAVFQRKRGGRGKK